MTPSTLRFRRFAAVLACSIAATLAPQATAQTTAVTDAVGFITLAVSGAGAGGGSALSFKGLGLTRTVEYQGSAETVGANTLTDNEATWGNNQFNGAGNACFVEIIDDPAVAGVSPGTGTTYDVTNTNAATKTLTLAQNLAPGVAAGAKFKVRKHWTIDSVFGANTLTGGTLGTADQLLIYNGTGYDIYYYQIDPGLGNGWRNANDPFTDAGTTVLYPDDGLIIRRKQSANVNVILMGAVKTGQSSIPMFPGQNIVSSIYAAPLTLGSSGLRDAGGDTSKGVAGGLLGTADQILLWNGTGYDIYYFQIDPGLGDGWRNANDPFTDAAGTQIPVGSAFIVKRKGATGFDWIAPQHPASL